MLKEKENLYYDPYPEDVAAALIALAGIDADNKIFEDMQDALYEIKSIAENPYNHDYWRVLWDALQIVTDKHPAETPI